MPPWVSSCWWVNSSPPSAAYMCQWIGAALFQIMACRLIGAKPLSKPMLGYWTLRNKPQWNFNQNTKLFIHKNAFEITIWELAAMLSRGRWVNILRLEQNGQHSTEDIFNAFSWMKIIVFWLKLHQPPLDMNMIFYYSWTVVTPAKYESDSNNLTNTFTKSEMSLMEESTICLYHQTFNISGALVSDKLVEHSYICIWSFTCQRCSNYIFILDLTPIGQR